MSKEEIWKDVVGYESILKVNDIGDIKIKSRTWLSGRWVTRTNPEKMIATSFDRKGYVTFCFNFNGKVKTLKVHRVVAQAFIPNPQNKPQVNHKDGIKTNNMVDNLEWCTMLENMRHAHSNGLIIPPKGEAHGMVKLTNKDVIEIRNKTLPIYKLAEKYKVSRSTIDNIQRGKSWKHLSIPSK